MALNLDQEFYLIVLAGRNAPYFAETSLADATREKVIEDITSGQFDGPDKVVAVLYFNPAHPENFSQDVSDIIAYDIANRALAAGEPPSHEARLYCERYGYEFRDRVQEAAE
jgi:hypothetical protein